MSAMRSAMPPGLLRSGTTAAALEEAGTPGELVLFEKPSVGLLEELELCAAGGAWLVRQVVAGEYLAMRRAQPRSSEGREATFLGRTGTSGGATAAPRRRE